MLDIVALTTATANLAMFVLAVYLYGRRHQTAAVMHSLRGIHDRVEAMRNAQDHYAQTTDRRLKDVEAAAAEAAQEARIVSVQLGEMTDTLDGLRATSSNGHPTS